MRNNSTHPTTFAGLLLNIISSWGLLLRALSGLLAVLGVIFASTLLFSLIVNWLQPPVEVTVSDTGAVVIAPTKSKQTGMFLLSANGGMDSPWVNTGIEIKDGQKFSIKASGRICLAFHHMVDAAHNDDLPAIPWTGPDGLLSNPPRQFRQEEQVRKTFRVAPNLAPGRLIGVISPNSPQPNPPAESILDIGSKNSFTAQQGTGFLWLTVNDIWLDETKAQAYTNHTEQEFKEKIADRRYWNIWYDDNAGSFLVTIEIEP